MACRFGAFNCDFSFDTQEWNTFMFARASLVLEFESEDLFSRHTPDIQFV